MNIQKKTLDNGLTSVVIPQEDTPTATVMVMVGVGSRFEDESENGISHFLEHMFFKGTKNRPSSHVVSTELDSLGAESNAFTSHEYTAYYGKAQADKTDSILEILSDIYKNSLFPEEEIRKESGVITEEIRMYNDLPMQLIHDVFQAHMFPNHPLGRLILGTEENVNSFQRQDFIDYKQDYYHAQNTTVIVTGGVPEKSTKEKIKGCFANVSNRDLDDPKPARPQPESRLTFRKEDSDQTHLVVGAPTVERESDELPAIEVLSTIIGRGMSSRLFKKLRDEMGVCYYVKSSVESYTDTGLFKVSTGVDTDRLSEVTKVIADTLKDVAEEGVDQDELEKAREFVAGNFLMDRETTDQVARDIAKQAVLDEEIKTPGEYTSKLQEVSSDEVQQAAKNIISDDLYAAVIGPKCNESKVSSTLVD